MAATTFFSTGNPDGKMATASRPESPSGIEIESADDFTLSGGASITGATFTGLLTGSAQLSNVVSVDVEIYRVFPALSDPARTIRYLRGSTRLLTMRSRRGIVRLAL